MARPKITLYVDTVSPFAYEAYYILRNEDVFKACDITYVPIFLGGLMQKCGNIAPIKIKNKDKWMSIERLRWARHFGIPMTTALPPDFPAPTLPIMRALCVVAASDPEPGQPRLTRALDTFFAQHWAHGAATHKPEVLRATLAGLFGEAEAERILQESTTPQTKQALAANTDRAFDSGAFGLPWLECTTAQGDKTEGFWGVDHLGQVVQFLGLDPLVGKRRGQGDGDGNGNRDGERSGSEGWKALL